MKFKIETASKRLENRIFQKQKDEHLQKKVNWGVTDFQAWGPWGHTNKITIINYYKKPEIVLVPCCCIYYYGEYC